MLAWFFASAALATAPAPPVGDTGQSSPARNTSERVCRQVRASVGTIMTRRVCRTVAEWQAIERITNEQRPTQMPPARRPSM